MKKALGMISAFAAMAEAFQNGALNNDLSQRPPNDKIKPVLFSAKKKPCKFKPKQFKKRKGRSK